MIYNFLDNIYLNFLKNNNFNLLNKLDILSRDINLLFKDSNTNIKNILLKKKLKLKIVKLLLLMLFLTFLIILSLMTVNKLLFLILILKKY